MTNQLILLENIQDLIDLSKYSKGIYMIRVRTNNKLVDERIILH